LKEQIKELFKSDFLINVLTLATGTTISQAIPVAISPILTRIYSPEDFGLLALFLSVIAIFSSIINGKYEAALMIPKSEYEALVLFKISIIICSALSLVLLIFVFFFKASIAQLLGSPEIASWLYLLPIATILIGIYNSLTFINIRKKKYIEISKSVVYRSLNLSFIQVFLGFLNFGVVGLFVSQIFSYCSGHFVLFKSIKAKMKEIIDIPQKTVFTFAKDYIKFPLLTMPGYFLNSIAINLNSFFITSLFNIGSLGYFSVTNKVLAAPSMILGSSISKVYFQKMTKDINENRDTMRVFKETLMKLLIIGLPIFLFLFFTIRPAFIFIFGFEWVISAKIAKILIPYLAIRFVSSALSPTLEAFQKQEWTAVINLVLILVLLLLFFASSYYNLSLLVFFKYYSALLALLYMLFILLYYVIILKYHEENLKET